MSLTRRSTLAAMAAAGGTLLLPRRAMAQTAITGDYAGTLDVGSVKLRLRLVLNADSAVLYSLDQGNAAIPATAVKISGESVALEFEAIGARFDAVYKDGRALDGVFTQGRPLPLRLERGAAPPAPVDRLAPLLDGTMDAALLGQIRSVLGTPAMGTGWHRGNAAPVRLVDGLRAAGSDAAVTVSDAWHLGSITKSFTATLFARMVRMGAIRWDSTIDSLLGPALGPISADYAGLTAIELMSHHGGLAANIPLSELLSFPREVADSRADRLRYARLALAMAPVAARRTKLVYSNSGYVLAGAMLEAATGQSWEALVKAHVLTPLSLGSAGFGPPGSADAVDQPRGHDIGPDGVRTALRNDNPAVLGPAGRLHLNLADLLTYLDAHRSRPAAFLDQASWDMLHQARFGSDYALGWFVAKDGTRWHGGSNTAWYAEAVFHPGAGISAAVTANDAALIARPLALLPAIRRAAMA